MNIGKLKVYSSRISGGNLVNTVTKEGNVNRFHPVASLT